MDIGHHPTIPDEIHQDILRRISKAEQEHNVKVLLAIESGSRAWGFASPNSDYDVRFIYAHPKDWYISIDVEEQRDVIEYPIVDDIDINGWDIRKALKLLTKSNPAVIEWLQSPIVYVEHTDFKRRILSSLSDVYNPTRGVYHYRSMANDNHKGYLQAEQVKLKKYFYVLRALFAANWINTFNEPAPIEFDVLRSIVKNDTIQQAIDKLLAQKKQSLEKDYIAPVPALDNFIAETLTSLADFNQKPSLPASQVIQLNQIFRETLSQL